MPRGAIATPIVQPYAAHKRNAHNINARKMPEALLSFGHLGAK